MYLALLLLLVSVPRFVFSLRFLASFSRVAASAPLLHAADTQSRVRNQYNLSLPVIALILDT
jgi:hypothetical protein